LHNIAQNLGLSLTPNPIVFKLRPLIAIDVRTHYGCNKVGDATHEPLFPVDVFHFKTKHSTTDEFCQNHCNPKLWPELTKEDGSWRFNSSAAEQSNVWVGGFNPITREMLPHRFNFFMDEMIQRRNQLIVSCLCEQNKSPWRIPFTPNM
jgi:hypothetical protein